MEKAKRNIWHVVICVGLLCLVWGGYILGIRGIVKAVEDDFSWVFQVDSVKLEDKKLRLIGFAFEVNKDVKKGMYEIVLQDIETKENYFANMKYGERNDVNDYFLCEYDYLESGFTADFNIEKLALQEKDYEVLLKAKGKKSAYKTGTFLSKGELVYANPKEFIDLDVEGTELENIVREGVLRVYRPDYGMYVYQYERELYWIAEHDYSFFSDNDDMWVQYQLYTTQVERLPQERIDNKWFWSNIGFHFKKNELIEWETDEYRVTKCSIPTEYSVTHVVTGHYGLESVWHWKTKFRPWYVFSKEKN